MKSCRCHLWGRLSLLKFIVGTNIFQEGPGLPSYRRVGPTVSLGGGGVVRPEVHFHLLLIAGGDTVKDLVLGLGLPPPTACGTLVAANLVATEKGGFLSSRLLGHEGSARRFAGRAYHLLSVRETAPPKALESSAEVGG